MGQRNSTSVPSSVQEIKSNLAATVDYEIDSPRFSVHDARKVQEGIEYLNEHGYAVFADVLSPDEITSNIDLLWKHLENLPSPYHIRGDNAKTWDFLWPGIARLGLMANEGIGQSQFMWSVRGNPNVKKIFAQIWHTSELLVSFDAAGCFRDWHLNRTWKTSSGWYHCDQHPIRKPDRCSIQGLVSITDSNEFTGGLTRQEFVRDRVACTHWPHELNASSLPQFDEKQALKLNAYQQSLIIGTNVDANDAITGTVVDV
ncbi:unnamed protein product [Rotaria sordida]|uniref:Phytanoyl-CoA dioxygenase n=1 Tax=Rotaria sordida TaxID=392033 RepID=A0A814RS11_9BILA|nr:unnamed protein product [Rotaria sordida]CAF1363090.1 unnamed protein product [Rotaria sordida]